MPLHVILILMPILWGRSSCRGGERGYVEVAHRFCTLPRAEGSAIEPPASPKPATGRL
jgi:hypothetical protein